MDSLRAVVRSGMGVVAKVLNRLTGGQLSPNSVTLIALAAHIPIALAIASSSFKLAAGLLIFFGLFDALDGELARLQKRASQIGMLLDSVSDRMKEIVLYIGVGYFFVANDATFMAVWAVAAVGASILVSYVNAWGEAVIARSSIKAHDINKSFRLGVMGFEIRMATLVIGLLTNHLAWAVMVIAIGSWLTAIDRLIKIAHKLKI